jgi:N-acetylneuraminic acid mutarotase
MSRNLEEMLRAATESPDAVPLDAIRSRLRQKLMWRGGLTLACASICVALLASFLGQDGLRPPQKIEPAQTALGELSGDWSSAPDFDQPLLNIVAFWVRDRPVVVLPSGVFELNSERGAWVRVAETPLPDRPEATVVWTGEEALVWGGPAQPDAPTAMKDGAFDVQTRLWRPIPAAPIADRFQNTAVWTGSEMLVWGGASASCCGQEFGDGAAYDPVTNDWAMLPEGPLAARTEHTSVWTGKEMLVWGGLNPSDADPDTGEFFGDGAAYDPLTMSWRSLSPAPIEARAGHTAVWTGTEMIIWGGRDCVDCALGNGAAYDPLTDSWRNVAQAPLGDRYDHSAVWADGFMHIWGGLENYHPQADGAAYDAESDEWRPLPSSDLAPRYGHLALTDGEEMLVLGGCCVEGTSVRLDDGGFLRIGE